LAHRVEVTDTLDGIIEFTLIDFLKTGSLGAIHTGLSQEQIVSILGQPYVTARFKLGKARYGHIWKYEDLELTVIDSLVTSMQMETHPSEDTVPIILPVPLKMDGLALNHSVTMEEFMQYLKLQKIDYTWDPSLTFDFQSCLLVEGRVKVVFDEEERLAALFPIT
jgi:hypothetical protein